MNFRRGSRNEEPEINLIPLIDVVLVIIIFLMLTTTFSKVSGLEINLPTAESEGAESVAEEIVVAVTAAGEVLVNRQPVGERSIDAIAAALGKAVPGQSAEPPVIVIKAVEDAFNSVELPRRRPEALSTDDGLPPLAGTRPAGQI